MQIYLLLQGLQVCIKKDLNENLTKKHNHNIVCNASKDSMGKGRQVTFLVIEEISISI